MTSLIQRTRQFFSSKSATASIEFAFVFPMLVTSYLFLADVTVAIIDNRKLSAIANSAARIGATFPTYDESARLAIRRTLFANSDLLNGRLLAVRFTSLEYKNGSMRQVFTDNLYGGFQVKNNWASTIENVKYVEDDSIIWVHAELETNSYISKFFNNGNKISAIVQTQSYNGRKWTFDKQVSDKDFYNWQ